MNELKDLVSRAFPPGHPAREVVLRQPDILDTRTFLARCEDWLVLAEVELSSARWGGQFDALLDPEVARRLRSTSASLWMQRDRELVNRAFDSYRGGFLRSITALGVTWTEATISPGEISLLRVTAGPWWGGLTPAWDLATLLAAINRGRDTPDPTFSRGVRELTRSFDPAKVRGRPILVGQAAEGPLTILEGTTRLLAVLSKFGAKQLVPAAIPVYVGLTPRFGEWEFRGSP